MNELTGTFEGERARLRAVAYQLLGSATDAEDAVQETWLRLHRTDAAAVDNLAAWLTTVVSRVSLDMLRRRRTRAETVPDALEYVADDRQPDPAHEAVLADAVGPALMVVLDSLRPVERLAFVLHDVFALTFEEVADIVGRSPAAVRQLTSRARRRISGVEPDGTVDVVRQRRVVDAFLAASREGDFAGLIELLDPDAVLRADEATVAFGAEAEVRTAHAVATTFAGRARAARLALIDGAPGAVWSTGGVPKVVFEFEVSGERVTAIRMIADPQMLAEVEVAVL